MFALAIVVGFFLMAMHKWAPDKLSEAPAWTSWAVASQLWAVDGRLGL